MLRSRFDTIAAKLDDEIDEAMRAIAQEILVGAKARVPVESGALRDSIHVDRRGQGEYSVVAGDNKAYYGHMVENGSATVGGGRQPPRPFLAPAREAARAHIDEEIRRVLLHI